MIRQVMRGLSAAIMVFFVPHYINCSLENFSLEVRTLRNLVSKAEADSGRTKTASFPLSGYRDYP